MATLKVHWKTVDTIAKKSKAVVTGEEETEEVTEEAEAVLAFADKPILVYVCDDTTTCADSEKFETIVLADEKCALGVRAFHCFKMTPSQVDEDPILEGAGKSVPRVLLLDPTKMKVKSLETKDLKASKLFKGMKSVAGKFWKEKLDKVVKSHLKMLTEQDQLSNAEKTLAEKKSRVAEDEKKLEKVKEEIKEVREKLAEIAKAQADLWKLTPKKKAA